MSTDLEKKIKNAIDIRKWGWMEKGCVNAHGEFDSREEAISHAQEYDEDKRTILVGRCEWADARAFLPSDIDELLDIIEETAYDNGFDFCDDSIFEIKTWRDQKGYNQ